jgi:hypothetical protein
MVLYLDDLVNPNNGINLVPNPLLCKDVASNRQQNQESNAILQPKNNIK